jgi:hypothetical protein
LNQVREQIETMEGKLRVYDNLTSLATLTLSVAPEAAMPAPPPSFAQKARDAWTSSVDLLSQFVQLCGILAIASLPWMALVAPFALLTRHVYRSRRRKAIEA